MYKLPYISELEVLVKKLELTESGQSVLYVQTVLSRMVGLKKHRGQFFKADAWKTEPVLKVVLAKDLSAEITEIVLAQVEQFIVAYTTNNQPGRKSIGANSTAVVPKRPGRTVA